MQTLMSQTQEQANRTNPSVQGNLPVATDGARMEAFRRNEAAVQEELVAKELGLE